MPFTTWFLTPTIIFNFLIHMFIKYLPKFQFLQDTKINKNINRKNKFNWKSLINQSIIIDSTNKDKSNKGIKRNQFIIYGIYPYLDSRSIKFIEQLILKPKCGPHISAYAFSTRMASLIYIWKIMIFIY